MKRRTRPTEAPDLEPVWRALASPVRRRILDALRDGPRTTSDLSEEFPDLSRFAVMQHLTVLVEGALVIVRREGRYRYNRLNPIPIQQIYDRWVSRYEGAWAEALVSLKANLEAEASDRAHRRTGRRRGEQE